jgi:hypothetical protein
MLINIAITSHIFFLWWDIWNLLLFWNIHYVIIDYGYLIVQ